LEADLPVRGRVLGALCELTRFLFETVLVVLWCKLYILPPEGFTVAPMGAEITPYFEEFWRPRCQLI
jgi:hypothetical protein